MMNAIVLQLATDKASKIESRAERGHFLEIGAARVAVCAGNGATLEGLKAAVTDPGGNGWSNKQP